jgi:hypothetical protein
VYNQTYQTAAMKKIALLLFVALFIGACSNEAAEEPIESFDFGIAMMEAAVTGGTVQSGSLNQLVFGPTQQMELIRSLLSALRLTNDQQDQVRGFVRVLTGSLMEIRWNLHIQEINRQEALVKIRTARMTFLESVRSILTDQQKDRFALWVRANWDK